MLIFSKILECSQREVEGPLKKEVEVVEAIPYHHEKLSESFQLCRPKFIPHFDRLLDKETEF